MANTFLTPSVIARESLIVLENNLIAANLVHRDYSDEFVQVGDTVTIIGENGGAVNSCDALANLAETIPYEILCGINKRVPRLYMENDREVERSLRLLL